MNTFLLLSQAQHLTRVHHRNLVSLVGYCNDKNRLALVYEFMPQGTLQDHLRGLEFRVLYLHVLYPMILLAVLSLLYNFCSNQLNVSRLTRELGEYNQLLVINQYSLTSSTSIHCLLSVLLDEPCVR